MFPQKIFLSLLTLALLCVPLAALAAMSSTNYTIYADSVGAGGVLATSASYSLQDVIGESPGGFATTSAYEARAGYMFMEQGNLRMTVSNSSLSLGTLSAGAINSAETVVVITTDSETGYTLSVGSASGSIVNSVADGAVTAGVEEYGLAVSGGDRAFANDSAVSEGLLLASSSTPATNSQTTLIFKASVTTDTSPGERSQSMVLSVSANL